MKNPEIADKSDNEDFVFFKTLISNAQLVKGPKKLDMRMELTLILQNFAFKGYKTRLLFVKDENIGEDSNDEMWKDLHDSKDETFFESLMPYVGLVKGANKSLMRSIMILLVKKYAFENKSVEESYDVDDGNFLNFFLF